jgi:pyruvate/2-oxoglutarate dehydrogenase complex dihydrolipoamide dehydrogenase (E3) component
LLGLLDTSLPQHVFTDPELVRVALNETEAKSRGVAYRLATLPIAAVLRTRTVSEPR